MNSKECEETAKRFSDQAANNSIPEVRQANGTLAIAWAILTLAASIRETAEKDGEK